MNSVISQTSIIINYIIILICFGYILKGINFINKAKVNVSFILTLPSLLIPSLIIIGYCMPIIWMSFDREFRISYLNSTKLEEALLFILGVTICLFLGHLTGMKQVFKPINLVIPSRSLDSFLYGKLGNDIIIILIIMSLFVFPFTFGLRIELIFGSGIRGIEFHGVLATLIPFARIVLSILTFLSGIVLAYKNSKIILLIPFLDILQHLMKLSRGFFIPFVLFLFAYSLSGKKIPKWGYFSMIFLCFASGSAAIGARGLSAQGVSGVSSGFNQLTMEPVELVRQFFEANAVIGLISTAVHLRDPSSNFIEGFIAWLQSILPIPTFFELTGKHLSLASLLNITHAGIPMPTLGEIYFRMGWFGLAIFFIFGIALGIVEGELIKHTILYGKSYWPHIMIWLSMLSGFILSFHSPSRSASRLLLYTLIFIGVVKLAIHYKIMPKNSNVRV
ncbi:hypothetical protein ABN584_16140 [Gloeocapsa sp. BRSZ]